MNQTSSSCLLEEIELLPKSQREPIRSLQILHSQSVLFVGLQEHVIKVPLKRCLFYKTYRYEESASFFWLEKNTCRGLEKNGKDKCLQVGIQIYCLSQQLLPVYPVYQKWLWLLVLDEALEELKCHFVDFKLWSETVRNVLYRKQLSGKVPYSCWFNIFKAWGLNKCRGFLGFFKSCFITEWATSLWTQKEIGSMNWEARVLGKVAI